MAGMISRCICRDVIMIDMQQSFGDVNCTNLMAVECRFCRYHQSPYSAKKPGKYINDTDVSDRNVCERRRSKLLFLPLISLYAAHDYYDLNGATCYR